MPETIRVDRHGGTPWIQTIYQTWELRQNNGQVPETVLARQLSATLDDLGVDHEIFYGYDPVITSTQRAVCGSPEPSTVAAGPTRIDRGRGRISDPPRFETGPYTTAEDVLPEFTDFLNNRAPAVAPDSNLILTNANGGGCAFVGGNVGAAGVENVDYDPGRVIEQGSDVGYGLWAGNLFAAIHEINHNMGYSHTDGAGMAENRDGEWRVSAMVHPGHENRCGEFVPERIYDKANYQMFYHWCVGETMEIEDKPPLTDPNPPEPPDEEPPGTPPEAVIDVTVDGLTINADASASTGEGGITQVVWTFGDDTIGTGPIVNHTYAEGGTYTVAARVTAGNGAEDVAGHVVTVRQAPPEDGEGPVIGGREVAIAAAGLGALGLLIAVPEGRFENFPQKKDR